MPFEYSLARAFNAMSVRVNAPYLPGVYGISNSREWIFVGRTENIQHALMQHLTPSDTFIHQHKPTGFVFEVCYTESQIRRSQQLIREYCPKCNEKAAK